MAKNQGRCTYRASGWKAGTERAQQACESGFEGIFTFETGMTKVVEVVDCHVFYVLVEEMFVCFVELLQAKRRRQCCRAVPGLSVVIGSMLIPTEDFRPSWDEFM